MSRWASTPDLPANPISWENASALAGGFSILAHILLYFWFQFWLVGFAPPAVDPINPVKFKVSRVTIDPSKIESVSPFEKETPQPIQSSQADELRPEEITAFDGPIDAPRIPTPRIKMDTPEPLGQETATLPSEAFSSLPVHEYGTIPSMSQALVKDASTAALKEINETLMKTNLSGGKSSPLTDEEGMPELSEITSLVDLRPPDDPLTRPPFQPILLRLSSDVLFKFDSAELLPEAEASLGRVANFLAQAVRVRISIEGHTDTIGEVDYNERLSQQRAQAVTDWIQIKSNLPISAFAVRGFGESRPLVNPEGTADEQRLNRRVEIRIEGER